jgi:hypothetical protein
MSCPAIALAVGFPAATAITGRGHYRRVEVVSLLRAKEAARDAMP